MPLGILHDCETWYLNPREEHKFRVFQNRALRRIFGFNRKRNTDKFHTLDKYFYG
jgi:hypothetical protein